MTDFKILVAEDDPQIMELTVHGLTTAGYQTLEASNGLEAVDRFRQHQADIRLVLMDLVMPEMDGQEAAEEILRIASDTKILFVSGFIPANLGLEITHPILRKPFRVSALLESVEALLAS